MQQHQETVQDMSVLPTLEIKDIERNVERVDYNVKDVASKDLIHHLLDVKTWFYDQPTNGINHIRIKANLKSLPEHLRVFVPMFAE